MNILPLVFAFLTIFVLLSSSFTREAHQLLTWKNAYLGSMQASRSALSQIEEQRFKDITQKTPEKENEDKPLPGQKKEIAFRSNREKKQCDNEHSKFNLAPLFTTKSPKLYKTAACLIKNLYGQVPFFYNQGEGWEKKVLDVLLSNPGVDGQNVTLIDIISKQRLSEPLFYKLLRGTKKYHYQTGKGYPPLHHFFTINYQEKKAICFSKASKAILEAYFGDEITSAIISEEKKKWEKNHKQQILTKAELLELIQKKFQNSDPLEEISFSNPTKTKKKIYAEDPLTGISVEPPMPQSIL